MLRDQGFLQGFGIDLGDPNKWGDETDPRIVGNDVTAGNEEGGRKAMENLLIAETRHQRGLHDQRAGRGRRLRGAEGGRRESDVLIVSVDGGCPGVTDVKEGVIGATSQQYPLQMAALGIEAIKTFAETARSPRRPKARTSSTPASR